MSYLIRKFQSFLFNEQFFFLVFLKLSTLTSFSVFMKLFLDYFIGLGHIGACKTGSYTAPSFKSDEPIIVPAFQVSRHPITPFSDVHPPDLSLPGEVSHFHCLNLAIGDLFAVAKREEVTFDYDFSISDSHIFVVVQNLAHEVIIIRRNQNSYHMPWQ